MHSGCWLYGVYTARASRGGDRGVDDKKGGGDEYVVHSVRVMRDRDGIAVMCLPLWAISFGATCQRRHVSSTWSLRRVGGAIIVRQAYKCFSCPTTPHALSWRSEVGGEGERKVASGGGNTACYTRPRMRATGAVRLRTETPTNIPTPQPAVAL